MIDKIEKIGEEYCLFIMYNKINEIIFVINKLIDHLNKEEE